MTYTEIPCEPDAAGFIQARAVAAKMAFRPLVPPSLGTMRAELFAPPLFPADCFPAFP
jgi:hypothetical protein